MTVSLTARCHPHGVRERNHPPGGSEEGQWKAKERQ